MAILSGVRCYLIVVLIWISFIILKGLYIKKMSYLLYVFMTRPYHEKNYSNVFENC